MFLGIILGSALALAAPDNNKVFVSSFEPAGTASKEASAKLSKMLLRSLKKNKEVQAFAVQEMKSVSGEKATLYMESCPPGEAIGCTFVVAEGSNMSYAITGNVTALEAGNRVDIRIIAVTKAREALAFEIDISEGAEKIFVDTVVRALLSVMKGEVGVLEDIREEEESKGVVVSKKETEALTKYAKKSGGTKSVGKRTEVELETRELTKEMVQEMIEEEGSKEWDEYNMGPWEFMRYVNSGLPLSRWRQLMRGRKGQLIARVGVGVAGGPSHGKYYGRIARSEIDLSAIQTYAWQNVANGTGIATEGALTYGILPYLDVGVVGGVNSGNFTINLHSITVNQEKAAKKPDELPNNVSYVGGEANYVPVMVGRFKPTGGVAMTYHFGRRATEYVEQFPEDLPDLPAANLLLLSLKPGLELRVSDVIDFWLRSSVSMVMYSTPDTTPAFYQSGDERVLSEQDRAEPEDFSSLGFGISVGFQTRIGPFGQKKTGLNIYE